MEAHDAQTIKTLSIYIYTYKLTKVNERWKRWNKNYGAQHQPVQTKQNSEQAKPIDVRPEINCFTKETLFKRWSNWASQSGLGSVGLG